jgi:hypothetical protein
VTVAANDVVSAVAETMGAVLSRPPLRRDEAFFAIGGDSLRAVELITQLAERFSSGDPDRAEELGGALLIAIFDEATPDALGAVIERYGD